MSVLVVGTDFSTRSDRAVRRAILLARQVGYGLHLVAVVEDESAPRGATERPSDASVLLRDMQQTIELGDGIACRADLRHGRPDEQMASAAREAGAAMMVLGPHRRRQLRDAFGAITAERIMQHSPVPVIVANGVPSAAYRRLLVPVDLDEASRRAARAVQALAFGEEAEITLLHVYDAEAREMLGRAMVSGEERQAYLGERAAAAADELRSFAASVGLAHAALLAEEARGPVAAEIARIAAAEMTDLVVVSRSPKGAVGKAILGSVTEDLLRSAELDLLVVPAA